MDTPLTQPLTDAEINRLLDGEVQGAERDALLQRLQGDPHGRERLAHWQTQRDAIRQLHAGLLQAPVPPGMREAAHRASDAQARVSGWWRWGGMAAGIVLAFGVGRLSNHEWPGGPAPGSAPLATLPAFARDASVAHAVYSPEKRHPVEVGAADQEHLVQWLSRRTGKALKVPRLDALGYELVGGRLLPGDVGARAQFMFQNAQGVRITLYLGALDLTTVPAETGEETAFRFAQDGPVPGFYWVDQGFGYALSGPLSRDALMALAQAVYQQL
ncbi:MAG: anti-sigma factor [Hydrogenophaga sp.]|uniref:anti-sigma factor family protein n=1 Tax=Hydrogenophaga sp. TaxID=1904254 RepID=UPI0025C67EA5|nr:anti-sigma factor [Hydrogenophaga sp.]MBU7573774.1 anti-sigma factor [Hydrogenophaga sp.]